MFNITAMVIRIATCLLICSGALQTLRGQLLFNMEKSNPEQGWSDPRINCFLKDRHHYLWVGTKNGLNRFNGQRVEKFLPSGPNAISNESINALAEDARGHIWVATMDGLNSYDPYTRKWRSIGAGTGNPRLLPNNLVRDIVPSKNPAKLWLITDGRGLSELDIQTGKFRYFPWPAFVEKTDASFRGKYKSLVRIKNGNGNTVWLASTIGLFSFDTRTETFEWVTKRYTGQIQDMVFDSVRNEILISDEFGKAYGYSPENGEFLLEHAPPGTQRKFFQAQENARWLGHIKGLALVPPGEKKMYLLPARPFHPANILSGAVQTVYTDETGIRWLATGNGVFKYDRSVQSAFFLPLNRVSDPFSTANTMGGLAVNSSADEIFACLTTENLVVRIRISSGDVTYISADGNGRPFHHPLSLKRDANGDLWLLCASAVYRFQPATGAFYRFPLPENKNVRYRDLAIDQAADIWFSSSAGPLLRYRSATGITEEMGPAQGFPGNGSFRLLSDTTRGEIWASSFGYGVFRHQLSSGKTTLFTESLKVPHYKGLFLVNDMEIDQEGAIWIATQSGGIFKGNPGKPYDSVFRQFTMKEGLPSNSIEAIRTGDKEIWFLTGLGLGSLDKKEKTLRAASYRTFAFPSYVSEPGDPHFFDVDKTSGTIYTAVAGGILVYRNTGKKTTTPDFPIVIESVKTDEKEWWNNHTGQHAENVVMEESPAQLSIRFAALHYSLPASIRYEYRVGEEGEWNKLGRNNELLFRYPAPGAFNVHIRATDHTGVYSGKTAVLSLEIKLPFWRRWWFLSATALLIVFSVVAWVRHLKNRIKAEKIINRIATSLYGKTSIDEIWWEVARQGLQLPGFQDFVIYQYDVEKDILVQKAACGPKNPAEREILNPIEIRPGSGIVGAAALSLRPQRVGNTLRDKRYIVDEEKRLSELSVPIVIDGKLFGVLDSEHPETNFFSAWHEKLLLKIARLCAVRISRFLIEEQLRARIARDLHDEMGSTLTSINILSKIAAQQPDNKEELSRHLNHIHSYSAGLLDSMSDLVWTINPANDTFSKLLVRMKETAAEVLEPVQIGYTFRHPPETEQLLLNLEQRKNMYMIFREAMNNTIKHSGASEFNVVFRWENEILGMQISNNGKPFNCAQGHDGNGLRNMQSRAAEMNSSLQIRSGPGQGTTIELKLPFT